MALEICIHLFSIKWQNKCILNILKYNNINVEIICYKTKAACESHFTTVHSLQHATIQYRFNCICPQSLSKGAFHQRRSNLGSAEPGSTFIVDFNQVQVMIGCTIVKLGSADVVQLNDDGYTSWTLIGSIWTRSVTSHALFTLVLTFDARAAASSERLQPVARNVFLALIFWLSHHHGGEIWGCADSTVNHSLLLKVNTIKISYHAQYSTHETSFYPRRSHALK